MNHSGLEVTIVGPAKPKNDGAIDEDEEAAQARRLKEAEEHEAKLRHIMETVPIKIKHLQGSSAGAGSGEFHIYRKARTEEQKRLEKMEEEWRTEQERLIAKRQLDDTQDAIDRKTAKNQAKRQKRKEKKKSKTNTFSAEAAI